MGDQNKSVCQLHFTMNRIFISTLVIISLFVLSFSASISSKIDLSSSIDQSQEKDPENLEELHKLYICYKKPKKTCKTREKVKCHHKRIIHRSFKLCTIQPVEECHTKYENLCVKRNSKHDIDYVLRQYSG